jgi:phosphopantothenoylcysteine decarboxylase/phosphopantothenate--cysteine ligase
VNGKNVLLGVSGGIAAFKAAALASQLVQAGARVRVAMTREAAEFVGPVTFEGLTQTQVILSATQVDRDGTAPHIEATRNADLLVIAPATANLIAKLAAGACDDAVSLAALCCKCPRLLCPAMNDAMWENPVVQRNISTLRELGYELLGPVSGPRRSWRRCRSAWGEVPANLSQVPGRRPSAPGCPGRGSSARRPTALPCWVA